MLGNISIPQLLIILLIVLLLFGGKRLKSLATDLGHALKSFRKGMHDEETKSDSDKNDHPPTKQG